MANTQLVSILIAIVVVLISIVLFVVFLKKRVKRQGILLLGLSDAGKTLIFARLIYEKYVETHTSIKENVAEFINNNMTLQIIDVPGQERVRNRIFDQFKASARGLVYVIDANTVQKELRDVAEYLYRVLSDDVIQSYLPPLIILCNKQDEPMAKAASAVKGLLEKELNLVRKTKTSQLDSIDNKTDTAFLGKEGKDFAFDDLPFQITFAEASAIMAEEDSGPDITALEEWLAKLG